MATGTVKWFNEGKGYGFITPQDGNKDVYAHFRSILGPDFKTLREGQIASFKIESGNKGPQAVQVTEQS